MERPRGAIALARIDGVPVYIHWSFPAGALVPLGFARFEPVPSLYLLAGYVLLVLLHELGHLLAARLVKHEVFSIEISGAGGRCRTELPRDLRAAALIYSGGLLAQLVFLLVGICGFVFFGEQRSEAFSYSLIVATFMNAALLIVNLIPSRDSTGATDGYLLWKLLRYYLKQRF